MCNLYSITKTQDAMRSLFRVARDRTGNLPPMAGVFLDYPAPIVRVADGERELTGVTQHQNVLTISARPSEKGDNVDFLYRGIAGRAFEKRFNLADFVEAQGASLENGLLHIDLVRRVPEAAKPRRIEVGVSKATDAGENVTTIDHVYAA